jgi:acyl-CoA synthetase (AMP-forming)/AMP-acid ligase II
MLVGDIPRLNARRYGDKPAVIQGERILSWKAVNERANRIGSLLRDAGLEIGDRVAVLSTNVLEWPEISFGISKAGLVLVPVNVRLAVPEIVFLIEDCGARALIFDTSLAGVAGAVLDKGLELATALEIGGSSIAAEYESQLMLARASDPTPSTASPDDLRALVYTSGTTGLPKAVMNTHRTMLYGAIDHVQTVGMRSDDRGLAVTPFFTSGGTMRTLSWSYLGGSMVILPRFDEEQIVDHIKRYDVTTTIMVPTMLARMCAHIEDNPGGPFSSLRHIGYGSAPSTPALIKRVYDAFGCDLWQRYGQSEVAGFVTWLSPDDHRRIASGDDSVASSAGKESVYAEITIRDDDGVEVADGEAGEVVIACDANNIGYWNRPEVTAERFRENLLFTGDVGFRDPDGYIHLVDRKNDLIISGAFNIYPGELERVIAQHPGVHLVAVFGAPHPQWGETPVAAVVRRSDWTSGTERLEEELKQLCRSNLAGYKQPNRFEFLEALPVSGAGKILKSELKKSFGVAGV